MTVVLTVRGTQWKRVNLISYYKVSFLREREVFIDLTVKAP
jgi:hypothetical protein